MCNDAVLTSMRRDHVASTLIQRHFGTKCPLGTLEIDCEKKLLRLESEIRCYVLTGFLIHHGAHKISRPKIKQTPMFRQQECK